MSSFGVTYEGFVIKPLGTILENKNDEVVAIFGDSIDLTPQSPDGQLNGTAAESESNLWELAEAVYNSFNPNSATSAALTSLVKLNGIERGAASYSTVTLDLTGDESTVIPTGSLVKSDDGDEFATDSDATIVGGVASVAATAVELGQIEANAGTITTIVTAVSGWTTVTNATDATIGDAVETDAALRIRRADSVAISSRSLTDSIYSSVADLDNVVSVAVLENASGSVDGNGQAAHSVQVVVSGGDENDIAEAIFINKSIGGVTDGNTTIAVADLQGTSHNIKFTRPSEVDIYVTIGLTIDSSFPADGEQQIKDAISEYASALVAGDDVIYSRLFTPINSVPGHQIDDLFIGTSPSPSGTSNIAIAFNQLASFDDARIIINV